MLREALLPEATVLISSFDGYAECWGPVAHGFEKYWPDCPYRVLLMTEERDFEHRAVKTLPVGRDPVWSNRMILALARIHTPYVIYFQEDYWLNAPVDTPRVLAYVSLMERHRLNYLRLLAKPLPDFPFGPDERLGILADDAEYRTSAQIAIWRRDVLLDLLVPEESVWQFELRGTERSRKYGASFLSIRRQDNDDYANGIRYICTAINTGRWSRMARPYAQAEGLEMDFSTRATDTWWDDFKRSGPVGYFFRNLAHRLSLLWTNPVEFWRRLKVRAGLPGPGNR